MTESAGDFPLLRSGEAIYEKGIFAHAPSRLTFDLGGKWTSFSALAGLQRGGSSVVFVVRGGGRELFHSELLQGEETQDVRVNIAGVKTLELVSEDGGDGKGSDRSVWFNPRIAR